MALQSGDFPLGGFPYGPSSLLAALIGVDAAFVGVDLAEDEVTRLRRSNQRLVARNVQLSAENSKLNDENSKISDGLGETIDRLRRDRDAMQERIDALVKGAESADDVLANLTTVAQAVLVHIGDLVGNSDVSEEIEMAQLYFDLRAVVKDADAHLEGTAEGLTVADFEGCGPGCTCVQDAYDGAADPFASFGGEPE